jgi:glycine/D-amino acid oxidase-like deaminating enzyme
MTQTTKSLWLADRTGRRGEAGVERTAADVVVVGAGIAGLVTAVLLARGGQSVLVLEARTAGAVTTGNTTSKLSLLQGTVMSKIVARHGADIAGDYVWGSAEGAGRVDGVPTCRS